MNREQAKTLLPIIQAFAEGKEIQYISKISPERGWIDYKYSPFTQQVEWSIFNHNPHYYQWRIKPEKKTGWVNVYPAHKGITQIAETHLDKNNNGFVGSVWPTKEIAKSYQNRDCIACIEVSFEEGEGL